MNLLQPGGQTDIAALGEDRQTGSTITVQGEYWPGWLMAPGMLQSRLLLALEFPAGSKVEAGTLHCQSGHSLQGKRNGRGHSKERRRGESRRGESSSRNCSPRQEPPEDLLHPFHPSTQRPISLFNSPFNLLPTPLKGFPLSP